MIKWIVAGALAALGGLCLVPAASANWHSGVNCHPASPADANILRYGQSGIHNDSSTDTGTVYCSDGTFGGLTERLSIGVYDRNPTQEVCCNAQLQYMSGYPGFTSGNRCTTGSDAAAKTIDIVLPQNYAGALNMACTIPPKYLNNLSHLTTYYLAPVQ